MSDAHKVIENADGSFSVQTENESGSVAWAQNHATFEGAADELHEVFGVDYAEAVEAPVVLSEPLEGTSSEDPEPEDEPEPEEAPKPKPRSRAKK